VVPCKTEKLTEVLATLIADHDLRMEMGTNGRRRARTTFSPETAQEGLIALYGEMCNPILSSSKRAVA
jgi:glycosyltransferase involved in cell wall biosynthesis